MITLEQVREVQAALEDLCGPSRTWTGMSLNIAVERDSGLPGAVVKPVLRVLTDLQILSTPERITGREGGRWTKAQKRWTLLLPGAQINYVHGAGAVGYFALSNPAGLTLDS